MARFQKAIADDAESDDGTLELSIGHDEEKIVNAFAGLVDLWCDECSTEIFNWAVAGE